MSTSAFMFPSEEFPDFKGDICYLSHCYPSHIVVFSLFDRYYPKKVLKLFSFHRHTAEMISIELLLHLNLPEVYPRDLIYRYLFFRIKDSYFSMVNIHLGIFCLDYEKILIYISTNLNFRAPLGMYSNLLAYFNSG